MMLERREEGTRGLGILIHAPVRLDKCADEPGPDGSLMIGRIALTLIAAIVAHIRRMSRRKRAQPVGGQQLFSANVYNPLRAVSRFFFGQRPIWKRDGEELIRP